MIRQVNRCDEYAAFEVPSESKKGGTYEVWISRHDGWVSCTCMDCQCRGKGDWFFTLLAGDATHYCKHMRTCFQLIRRLLQKEQEKLDL